MAEEDLGKWVRTRMRQLWDICQANGWRPLSDRCKPHMLDFFDAFPHAVSVGEESYWSTRLSQYTSMTHFLDLFSPAALRSPPDYRNLAARALASPPRPQPRRAVGR